jgi:cell division protein FtsL
MSSFMQWVTHGIKRGRFEMSRRTAIYALVIVVLLTSVAVVYLMLVSRTAARGRRVEQMRWELVWLEKENRHLEVQIAEKSAATDLLKRAAEQGFIQAQEVEYIYLTAEEP